MLDINFIAQNAEIVRNTMKARGVECDIDEILLLYQKTKEIMQKTQELQKQKNALAKKIGLIKSGKSSENFDEIMRESEQLKSKLDEFTTKDREYQEILSEKLSHLPNILQDSVPFGESEDDNVLVKIYGKKPEFLHEIYEHQVIGQKLKFMDFESARKISGSRFVILHQDLARLERALGSFMLDEHVNNFGYKEISVPQLVNEQSMYGTGQLPKFENGYITTNNMYLIPTNEVSITNMVANSIVSHVELPIRYTAMSQCFRSESGAAGKDTVGMIRQHQFSKVELVSIVEPEKSNDEHERMLQVAENILQKLDLHYEVRLLCSGDTGFASSKTYDINVWLPGQNRYREISSCSNMLDFQTRRMMARFKNKNGKNQYLHTLNGSGLAIGRTMIAILENFQDSNGNVYIPKSLQKYMNDQERIVNDKSCN